MKLEKKHWMMLIAGVVILFLVYWFFFRKKKTESGYNKDILIIGNDSSYDPAFPVLGESGFKEGGTKPLDKPCPPNTHYDNGKCLPNKTTERIMGGGSGSPAGKFYLPDKNGTIQACPRGYSSCGYDPAKGNCCTRTVIAE